MPEPDAELARLLATAAYIDSTPYHPTRNSVRAMLVAHATEPSDHWEAQRKARKLLEVEGRSGQLTENHPCLVLGFPRTRGYYRKQRFSSLRPFCPVCVNHGTRYDECSKGCIYGIKQGERWVGDLVAKAYSRSGGMRPASVASGRVSATGTEPPAIGGSDVNKLVVPPLTAQVEPNQEEFLRSLENQARALEALVGSADHWAKPFYSSVSTLFPKTPRAFIGLNGAGNRFAHQYDLEDRTPSAFGVLPPTTHSSMIVGATKDACTRRAPRPCRLQFKRCSKRCMARAGTACSGARPVSTSCPSAQEGRQTQLCNVIGRPAYRGGFDSGVSPPRAGDPKRQR